jgi:FtsP/CotA-like multicopper oxidase with cupredoxin domain
LSPLPAGLRAFAARPPGGCDPKGSVTRSGNIVSVDVSYVRANFTINTPDPTNKSNGEDPVTLRSYGGCKSGPVIEILPGNTLRLTLRNELPADDPSCLANPPAGLDLNAAPGVGCFNTINLHTHGLHVSPAGNSDNVLLNIAPQTIFPYEINLPEDHPAGTFWYHAHRHGSTAVQVASGASGLLIIRGTRPYKAPTPANPHPIADIDTILKSAAGVPFAEQLFSFQQIAYACFNNDPSLPGGPWQSIFTTAGQYNINSPGTPTSPANAPWTCPAPTPTNFASRGAIENFPLQLDSPTIWDTNGRFTSVNGIVQPTMTIAAGEIQRWRFLHAGIHDTINLQIVRAASPLITNSALSGNRQQQQAAVATACPANPQTLIPQFEIAVDGLTRTKIRTLSGKNEAGSIGSNYMQPGYRSDVLVVFPSDGDYCLLNQAAPASERATNGKGRGQGPGGQGQSKPQLLAYIHVRGGHAVAGDLEQYVRQALYDGNPQLPANVRAGLKKGDITPWAPFTELAPPPPASQPQTASFKISGQPNGLPPLFQVNGFSYDPDVVNITRQVNTTDDWILTSAGEPHIFHIHVNPFEVIDVTTTTGPSGVPESIYDANGNCKPDLIKPDKQGLVNQYCGMYHTFRDTVFVENNYQVHIRTRYDRYIGEFVLHCHILDHEDAGMMLNVQIVPDLSLPGGGIGMKGMKHNH